MGAAHLLSEASSWQQAQLGWRRPVSILQIEWGNGKQPLLELQSVRSSTTLWDIARWLATSCMPGRHATWRRDC